MLILFPIYGSCQIQSIPILPKDSTVNLFEVLWKLEKKYFIEYYADGDYFYKAFAIPLSEADSNLEGEVLYEVYFLKGEYGEFPDGKMVRVGSFYKITSMVIEAEKNSGILNIKHDINGKISSYRIE